VWLHRNFAGGARQLSTEVEGSDLLVKGQVSLRQPFVFGNRNWLTVSTYAENVRPEEFRVKRLGGSATFERTLTPTSRVFLQSGADLVDFKADSTRTSFLVGYQIDTRDDFFDPKAGVFGSLALEESGRLFRSQEELFRVTGEGRWYLPAFRRSILAIRLRGGVILQTGSIQEVPNFERFFAGGANSVRGWRLNQLSPRTLNDSTGVWEATGGLSIVEGSVELRSELHPLVGTAIFLDGGRVGEDQSEAFELTSLRWSAGAGVRYLSPIGPVRLDFAYRLSDNPFTTTDPALEGRWRIYFSLGQSF
jgi:outer membrane protein assembly factor BamA